MPPSRSKSAIPLPPPDPSPASGGSGPSMSTASTRARTVRSDAKYYTSTLSEHFGKESVRVQLYQLTTYMRHMEGDAAHGVRGVLLYPRTTKSVLIDVRLTGRDVRIARVDLTLAWY
jgi:5-methylcytosine-specific restriction enzyme subunit McrC